MAIGISFDSNSFKEFNRALKEFDKISVSVDSKLVSIGNSIDKFFNNLGNTNISSMKNFSNEFVDFSSSVDNIFKQMNKIKNIKFGDAGDGLKNVSKMTKDLSSIFKIIGSLSNYQLTAVGTFGSSVKTLLNSFNSLSSFKVDLSNLLKFKSVVEQVFTGSGGIFASIFGGGGLINILSKLGKMRLDGLKSFSVSAKNLTDGLVSLSSVNIDPDKLKQSFATLQQFTKLFTGKSGLFSGIKNKFDGLLGKGSIIELIANAPFEKMQHLSVFSKALTDLTAGMSRIARVNLNKEAIKSFADSLVVLIKTLNQKFEGGNIFARIFGFFQKGNPNKNFLELADAFDKLSRASQHMSSIREAMQFKDVVENISTSGKNSGLGFIASFKKVMGIASPSKVMQQLGEFAAEGFKKGFNILSSAFSSVKGFLGGVIENVKSIAGKIGGFFKNLIPFNPFNKLNEDASQSGNFITRIFNGLKDSIVVNISGLIQNVLSSAFDTLAGSAIQFESGFAGVLKAMDTSDLNAQQESEYVKQLDKDLRGLAVNSDSVLSGLENASSQILTIAENAGSLGIARENVNAFTETVGAMAIATNLSADAASTFFGTFGAVTGTTEYERLGSTMVELGNKFSATESQIADFSLRLAGAGESAGFSEAEILGVSAAMASVGLNAEAGGSAMTQIFDVFTKAVAKGGSELDTFTEIMGISSEEFKKSWSKDPAEALTQFVDQFGKLDSATQIGALDTLGLDGIRTADVLRRLGNAEGTLANALDIANDGWQKNSALMEEAEKRNQTAQSSINRMRNVFFNLQVVIGRFFAPIFKAGIDLISEGARNLTNIIETNYDVISGFFKNVGEAVAPFFNSILDIGKTLREVFGNLFSSLFDKFRGLAPTFGGPLGIIKNVIASISKAIQEVNFFLRDVFGLTSQVANALGMKVDNSINTAGKVDNEMAINGLYDERLQIVEQINELQTGGAKDFQDYVVKAGDTLSDIAAQNGISLNDLLEANNLNLSDAKNLQVDTKLKIPVKLDTEAAQGKIDELQNRLEEIDKPKAGGKAGGGIVSNYSKVMESVELVKGSVHSLAWEDLPHLKEGFAEIGSGNYADGFNIIVTTIQDVINKVKSLGANILEALFGGVETSGDTQSVMMNATQGIFSDATMQSSIVQPSAISSVANSVKSLFDSAFNGIDLQPQAQLLLNGLGLAISFIFGAPGALVFGLGKLVSEAISNDFLGIDTFFRNNGVYDAIQSAVKLIQDFIGGLFGNQTAAAPVDGIIDISGATTGISDGLNTLQQTTTGFDFFDSLSKIAENPALVKFTSLIGDIGTTIKNFVSTITNIDLSAYQNTFTSFVEAIEQIGSGAFSTVIFLIQTFILPVITNFGKQIEIFINSFDPITNVQKQDASGFVDFWKAAVVVVGIIGGSGLLTLGATIAGPMALIGGLANSIGTFGVAFKDLFESIGLLTSGDISGFGTEFGNFLKGMAEGIKGFTIGAVQPFIDLINKLLELTGIDLHLISVEQAFADIEKYIRGVGIVIALFLEDLKSRIELQFLDIQLRVKQAQIDIQLAIPEAARDNTYLADLQKQKAELEKFQQDRAFSFDFQSQLAGQYQTGTLDLSKTLTVTGFDGNPIQKSLMDLINDPGFVSQMSGSTKQLLINSADQAFKSSDPIIKANAAQVYASLHTVIPDALLPKQNEELIATGLKQYQDLIASGFTNVKIAPADYQSFFEDISYAASNEIKLNVPVDKINQFGNEVMTTMRDSFQSGASNEDMASIWDFVAGDVSKAKAAGVDMATGLLDGAVEAFNNQDQSTLMSSFLPTIDPESVVSIQEQFDQQLALIASKYGPDKAAQIGQAVEIGLENLTLTATGESVDLVVDPAKIQTDLETNQQQGINTFIDFGSNLIAGLTQGLTGENDLTNTVETVFNTANDAFKTAAGIESPSTVFAEHGLNLIEGLAQGINDNVGIAQTAFAPLMAVVNVFGLQMNAIFDNYLTKMSLVGITTIAVALQITNGFLVMSLQSILLGISLDGLLMKINSVLTGLAGIAVGAQVAINTGTGATVPVPAAAMPSTGSTENREFGGGIQASKVYEVLENQLPFEMFAGSNGKKYFIANQNGTMYSPRGSALPAGYGATNNNNSNITNGGDTYDIQINGANANPKEIADAVMNKISSSKNKEGKRIHKTLRRNGVST